jgi:flagellar basal-body rod protein FlgB
MYRVPLQPALDGNTVDTQVEQAEFTRNAIQHQASLMFLDGRIKGILTAIKGQ